MPQKNGELTEEAARNIVRAYLDARAAFDAASARSDAAYDRYLSKLEQGKQPSGAAYIRLSNRANDLYDAFWTHESRVRYVVDSLGLATIKEAIERFGQSNTQEDDK